MNWRKIYTLATPNERGEVAGMIIERMEARQYQLLQARADSIQLSQGLPLDQRRQLLSWAHFIGMRPTMTKATRALYRGLFVFILGTLSAAIGTIALAAMPAIAAPLICAYAVTWLVLILVKPYTKWKWMLSGPIR
jgi:hypothetical protein